MQLNVPKFKQWAKIQLMTIGGTERFVEICRMFELTPAELDTALGLPEGTSEKGGYTLVSNEVYDNGRYVEETADVEQYLRQVGIDRSTDSSLKWHELRTKYAGIPDQYVPRWVPEGVANPVRIDIADEEVERIRKSVKLYNALMAND